LSGGNGVGEWLVESGFWNSRVSSVKFNTVLKLVEERLKRSFILAWLLGSVGII